jgi:hypothetical protein
VLGGFDGVFALALVYWVGRVLGANAVRRVLALLSALLVLRFRGPSRGATWYGSKKRCRTHTQPYNAGTC